MKVNGINSLNVINNQIKTKQKSGTSFTSQYTQEPKFANVPLNAHKNILFGRSLAEHKSWGATFDKNKKGALLSCVLGTLAVTVIGAFTNRFLIIPFYSKIMPIDAIVSACNAVNPMIDSIDGYILFGAVPFNFIKGVIISAVTFLVYKKLSHAMKDALPVQSDKKPQE